MIDIKLLASAHERVTYQLERANVHIDGVGNEHIAVLLDAAKAYRSAVAEDHAVNAAMMAYMRTKNATTHSHLMSDHAFDLAMHAASTAAKIHAAHRVNTDTMAGFDGGYDAGWQDAIETCALVHDKHARAFDGATGKCRELGLASMSEANFERRGMIRMLAQEIRALKPPGE